MNGRPKTLSVTPSHQSSLSSSKSSPCRVCSGQRMGLTGPHQLRTPRKCPYTGDTHRIPWKCPRTSAISRQDKRCVCSSASEFLLSFVATEKGLLLPHLGPPFLWTELTDIPTLTCSCSIQPGHPKPEEDPQLISPEVCK